MAVCAVLVATLLSLALRRYLQYEVLIGFFLAAIMVVATSVGYWPAIVTAVLGWATYNYLLEEPRYVLQLHTLQDVVVAALFVSVAALIGVLSRRVRAAAVRAEAHADQLDELLQASRDFAEPTRPAELHALIGETVARACQGRAWVYDERGSRLATTAGDAAAPPERLVRNALDSPSGHTAVSSGWRARPLVVGEQRLGCVAWTAPTDLRNDRRLDVTHLALMCDLAAAALARLRDADLRAEAEALVRTDALRTALLSSISHDFRTPLASIMASATAFIDYGPRFSDATRRELLDNIVQEGERLNRLVAKVLDVTRIAGGAIEARIEALPPSELVERSLEGVRRLARDVVFENRLEGAPAVLADPVLLETALTNVLENAARFSPPQGMVRLTLEADEQAAVICVTDSGPGVPDDLREAIFQPFRSLEPDRERSGLGLSIVRAFVEACGGRAWAAPRADRQPGLSVCIRLRRPLAEAA